VVELDEQLCVLHAWLVAGAAPADEHIEAATVVTVAPCVAWQASPRVCVPPSQLALQAPKLPTRHAYETHSPGRQLATEVGLAPVQR